MKPGNPNSAQQTGRLPGLLVVLMLPLAGCQGIAGSTDLASLRVIDASPDAPAIDVYQGGSALAYNLGEGTMTSYVSVPAGAASVSANQAGTHTTLVAEQANFVPGGQYTAVVSSNLATLRTTLLRDQATPAPAGQIAVRLVHASTTAGAVDLYLVPTGSSLAATAPLKTGLTLNGNSGYLNLPAGTYTLYVLPAGTAPSATASNECSTCSAVLYSSGAARTLVLMNPVLSAPNTVQVVTANDFDPPGAAN